MAETKQDSNSLFKKLLEVKKAVAYLQKVAQGAQYKYTSSSQVLTSVREKMNEVGLILTAKVTNSNLIIHEEGDEKKKRITYFTELWITFTWIDTETGQTLELPWYGQGVDIAGEKGVGKAMTYAEKYFVLKQFNIPTDKDDPDAFQEKNETPAAAADKRADAVKTLVASVNACKDLASVTALWTSNSDFQTDSDFKAAVIKMGGKYKAPKADKKSTDAGAATE